MINAAKKYLEEYDLSTIPLLENKSPAMLANFNWQDCQTRNAQYRYFGSATKKIGLICGVSNANIEVIDVDSKNELFGENIFLDLKNAIAVSDPDLFERLVIETTMSGGFHLIYRCDEIGKNQKLAKRPPSADELLENNNAGPQVLLETRGEGGYIACAPSPGYEIIQGCFGSIPRITVEERDIILSAARSLDRIIDRQKSVKIHVDHRSHGIGGKSPIDDYNEKNDVDSLLLGHGWTLAYSKGSCDYYLRPGTTKNKQSASYHREKKVFYVYTSSSIFESEKGYSPFGVYCVLEHGGDASAAVKKLLEEGYGEKYTPHQSNNYQSNYNSISKPEPINCSDIFSTSDEESAILNCVRKDGWKQGLDTGYKNFDSYYRFKKGELTVVVGQPNVGKTTMLIHLAVINAMRHKKNWLILTAENEAEDIRDLIMKSYFGKSINKMTDEEFKKAKEFSYKRFKIIKNTRAYTHYQFIEILRETCFKMDINNVLIDPLNSLIFDQDKFRDSGRNAHEYMYAWVNELLIWLKRKPQSVFINCHPNTEAQRRYKDKMLQPPYPADAEGGGKWIARADNVMVFHRWKEDSGRRAIMEISVTKIRNQKKGGTTTMVDNPVQLKMAHKNGFYSFYEEEYSPIADYHKVKTKVHRLNPHIDKVPDEDKELDFDLNESVNDLPF